jgi:hypothetical protein
MRAANFAFFISLLGLMPSWAGEVPAPVSRYVYRTLTCPQIVQMAHEVSRRGFGLLGLQPGAGETNSAEAKSTVIFLWPSSSKAPADQTSNLRYVESQIEALEQASIGSQCSILFERPPRTQTQ